MLNILWVDLQEMAPGINVNHYESQKWLKLAAKQHYKMPERLLAGLPAH